MSIILVAISGKSGHGKDSLCDMIKSGVSDLDTRQETLCFADPLKQAAIDIFGLSRYHMDSQRGKREPIEKLGGVTTREILQKLGTDFARNIFNDIWVYRYDDTIQGIIHSVKKNLIIFTTDMRFKNEYHTYDDYKEKYGIDVIRIRVHRPDFTIKESNHLSETDLDDIVSWDYHFSANDLYSLELMSHSVVEQITILLD